MDFYKIKNGGQQMYIATNTPFPVWSTEVAASCFGDASKHMDKVKRMQFLSTLEYI